VAVEERVLRTVDVGTGTAVSVGVEVVRTDGTVQQARAPCLLPDLATVAAVRVSGEAGGAGVQEFFSTSINIAASGGRAHAHAQTVPTLVVQRRPQASASSSSSGSSSSSSSGEEKGEDRGEEAAYMALLLSAMRGESDVERAVSAGLEACGPLLGVLLDA
jgi:hypothetical protein